MAEKAAYKLLALGSLSASFHMSMYVQALPSGEHLQVRVAPAPIAGLNSGDTPGQIQSPSMTSPPELPYAANNSSQPNDTNPACMPVRLGEKQMPVNEISKTCLPGYGKDYVPACWDNLQMSDWIPAWMSVHLPCALNHSCGPENAQAWTNEFLHETGGMNDNRDCSFSDNIDSGGCSHSPYKAPDDCASPDILLEARHSYLDWAIYSMTSPVLRDNAVLTFLQGSVYTSTSGKKLREMASSTRSQKSMTLSGSLIQ